MSDDKPRRWLDLLAGVLSGQLAVGSRTPVIDTPAWVTLEVLHGGFATGRYLAEVPPDDHERTVLDGLPVDAPGDTEREKLNRWYLTEDGRRDLVAAVRAGRYRITVP